MANLYEILSEIIGIDKVIFIPRQFSNQETQEINDKIVEHAKKKVGGAEYNKLEQYLIGNKDDKDLKEIIRCLRNFISVSRLDITPDHPGTSNWEIEVTYNIIIDLYRRLETSKYNPKKIREDQDFSNLYRL